MKLFSIIKKRISLKLTLTLVLCLAVIFGALNWYLIESRKQALEHELYARGQMAALVGAEAFAHFLEQTIATGEFTQEDLFDEDYQPITEGPLSGAAIPKYHTRYDSFFDQHVQVIEDAFLADPMVVFAVLVDRNGYLPTHNSIYSKPLTGDPETDRVGNRTKRIFDDQVGIAAARFLGAGQDRVLKQIYPRDTGVLMWDITAPVFVNGKHWGGFRIGFSMGATEASIARLRNTVTFASFAKLVICALVIMVSVSKYTRPLRSLTRSAQAIAGGWRKDKIKLESSDEIGELVAAFNQMSDALEQTTVSRDFYDQLVQSMYDLLIVCDPQGKIISVNKACCETLGCNEVYLLKQQVQDLVVLRESKHDWFNGQVAVRQNFTADVMLIDCDSEQVPMAMSCSPMIDHDKTLSGFILVFQDNRDRIRAEQAKDAAFDQAFKFNDELRQVNDAMEAKNLELEDAYRQLKSSQLQILQQEKMASIGQLAAGVAHEINNPMGFITSNLNSLGRYQEKLASYQNQLEDWLKQQDNPELLAQMQAERKRLKIDYLLEDIRDLLTESTDGAERVREIVQNLKSFSRVDQAEFCESDINSCLESTLAIAANEIKYKATVEKDFGPLPQVPCYPQQLNQVFLNILVNAAQAIKEKGVIKIRTWQDGGWAKIAISDTGSGIPEAIRHRIFEPFFTTKDVGKGTGLGMSISYEIIKKHGGDIKIESSEGQGTTFFIKLPLKREGDSNG